MIRFGPSGNSNIFYEDGHKSSLEAPKWLNEHGLNAYEYSFGHGVNMGESTALSLGNEAEKNGVLVSVHAPYYINLANPNDEMVEKSYGYILTSLKMLKLFKGKKCVFHPGSCGKEPREQAFNRLLGTIDGLLERVYNEGFGDFYICPETMGKSMQLGTVDEIIEICKRDKCLIPTLDFGHINSFTQGSLKSKQDYKIILDKIGDKLGEFKLKNLHIHFSKIEYGAKGEIKHLTLEDNKYGPEFEPLAEVIIDYGLTPSIICESKEMMMEDAIKLKKIYNNLGGK